ncbi:MAG: polysaccharide biosynthesis/export family protein [Deltaproteobacteria bacterium]|nr:polysaccharide biosynthesis/export family protein [Deltaproteobacteria bacterium]
MRSVRFNRLFCILFLAIAVCAAGPLPTHAEVLPSGEAAPRNPSDYLIGPEDVLNISIWKNADLSRTVIVRPDGMISFPLIGDIKAAGLTPEDLRKEVSNKIKPFQDTAVVSVIVEAINSYKVYVMGEVKNPGMYLLKNKATILNAIALSGGFSQFASSKIVLIRKKLEGSGEEKITLLLKNILYDEAGSNMVLRPGDTVFVP